MTDPGGRLRVLMVNTHVSVGGAARIALTLARAIDAAGDAAVSFYHGGDSRRAPPLYGNRRPGSRLLNAVLARAGGSLTVFDMGFAREVVRQSRAADVVHLHNLHGYYLDWDRLLRTIADRPLIWTWHDMWGATGRCAFALECDGWRKGCDPCPHLDYYPAAWFDHASREYRHKTECFARLSRLFVATPSDWLRQIAIERGFAPDRVVSVPNPIDVSGYEPVPTAQAREHLSLPAQGRCLLFVAADCDSPRKGFRHFLAVLERTGWTGLVAGGRPRELPVGVRYLGEFRDPRALSLCYSAADALVVPSLSDNSPNTVMESMACGTPVFGYATGGIPSRAHPRWGGVVPVGECGALADLVVSRLPDGKPVEATAELRSFVMKWAPEKIAREYLTLYRRAIAIPGQPGLE